MGSSAKSLLIDETNYSFEKVFKCNIVEKRIKGIGNINLGTNNVYVTIV